MSKKNIIDYLKNVVLLTIIYLLTGTMLYKKLGFENAINHLYFLTSLFFVISGSFHFILIRYINHRPMKFARIFMILTVIKILLYLIILIVYIFKTGSDLKLFLFTFLTLYLSFTIFEVVQLQKHLKIKGPGGHLIK